MLVVFQVLRPAEEPTHPKLLLVGFYRVFSTMRMSRFHLNQRQQSEERGMSLHPTA